MLAGNLVAQPPFDVAYDAPALIGGHAALAFPSVREAPSPLFLPRGFFGLLGGAPFDIGDVPRKMRPRAFPQPFDADALR